MSRITGRWRCRGTYPLLLILLLSFGLRICRLGDQSVWWDEGWSVSIARSSFAEILHRSAGDVHPPAYYLLLHAWRAAGGESEFALRFLSAGAGVLAVAAAFLLGRRVGGGTAGLLAALLLGLSRFHVWWSQEIRMYVLGALLAILCLWAALRLWDEGRRRDWVAYVALALLGLYTLYLFALVLVVANLVWLWVLRRARPRRPAASRWLSAQVAVVLLYAPWLAYALQHVSSWSSAAPVAPGQFPLIYWTLLTAGEPVNVQRLLALTLPMLAVILIALVALLSLRESGRHTGRDVSLLLLTLLLPAALVYLGSLPRGGLLYTPALSPRYLLIFAPAFAVLLGWGLARLWVGRRWPVGALLTACAVSVAGISLSGYYPPRILVDDYISLGATLQAYVRPGDAVVLHNDQDWPVFAYHYAGAWQGVPNGQAMTPESAAALLSPIWDLHTGVWLVVNPYAAINDPGGSIQDWLATRAAGTLQYRFDDKILYYYARTDGGLAAAHELAPHVLPPERLAASVVPGLRLVGYEQAVREVRSGDTLHLFLYWQGEGAGEERGEALGLSLEDRRAREWARVSIQWPSLPSDGAQIVRQQVELPIAPEVPDGSYRFVLKPGSGGEAVQFGRLVVRATEYTWLAPGDVEIAQRLDIRFDQGVRLLGYALGTETIRPGELLALTLYWQADHTIAQRYKVFTHLLGQTYNARAGSFLWGQQDNEPVQGTRPTSTWRAGEVVVDPYEIRLDPAAPAGAYAIEVGLYDPASGARLSVLSAEGERAADHVIIGTVTVERQP